MLDFFQILGYSGGIPTSNRGVSCMILSSLNYDIMVDCGEGSYLLWKEAKYKWKKLKYIIITHMHPDHIGGLVPLLFYRKIFDITTPLTIIGPPLLKFFVKDSFEYSGITMIENLNWINISNKKLINISNKIKIQGMEMKHKIPCWGYSFSDNKNKLVFITDTLPNKNSIKLAENADVLIHESTYEHKMNKKAKEHFHTTEIEAMEIADKAKVKRLILTHFSRRLSNKKLKEWTWNGKSCVIFNERVKI